jgi:hypothetical protein
LRQFLHGDGEPLQIARNHDDRDGQQACDETEQRIASVHGELLSAHCRL